MILSWFNAKEAEDFGHGLAEFYDSQSKINAKASNHKAAEKQQKLVSQVLMKAQQFKTNHTLNAYQKAKLGNAFKWKLRDLGHETELVDMMTKDLLLALR
ncbi:MAG: hypothetical protein HZC23_09430 [Rhodocyclales bacterium]|nr:hypothetical protein [Rhodocyclales bacterium]